MVDLLKSVFVALDEERLMILIQRCLKAKVSKYDIIAALNEALGIIGTKFEQGEYTLSDLMMAGIMYEQITNMKEMDVLRDLGSFSVSGTILLGTVQSDMHDIGKSMFRSAAGAFGFSVIDLGVDVSPEVFAERIRKYRPDILGISAVLTSALSYLKKTVDFLKEEGLRDSVKIIIGGNIADDTICSYIGADAYAVSAIDGVEICKKWVSRD